MNYLTKQTIDESSVAMRNCLDNAVKCIDSFEDSTAMVELGVVEFMLKSIVPDTETPAQFPILLGLLKSSHIMSKRTCSYSIGSLSCETLAELLCDIMESLSSHFESCHDFTEQDVIVRDWNEAKQSMKNCLRVLKLQHQDNAQMDIEFGS